MEHKVDEIDWSRMPRPQVDGYDTQIVAVLAKERYGFLPKDDFQGPSMFGVQLVTPMEHASDRAGTAPLDHPNIARTEDLLRRLWPEQAAQCAALLTEIWPLFDILLLHDVDQEELGTGCTCGNTTKFGGISSTVNGTLGFAEGIVHELGHWKLHAMGVHLEDWDDQLVGNSPDEMYESPIRKDKPRPMGACIQAQYSYLHVLDLLNRAAKAELRFNQAWHAMQRDRMQAGRETLKAWRPGKAGDAFLLAMGAWADELISEADALLPGL